VIFTVAYVVRAVAPGSYVLPQAFVEDMYRPDRFGRTATGAVEVTIEWVIPFAEGGGSDVWARFMAPFLSKHLPGRPNVIIRNVPGGGSITGTNDFYAARAARRARPSSAPRARPSFPSCSAIRACATTTRLAAGAGLADRRRGLPAAASTSPTRANSAS
jgi:hypothetical protein